MYTGCSVKVQQDVIASLLPSDDIRFATFNNHIITGSYDNKPLTRQKGSCWQTADINNYSLPATMPIMPVVYSCPKPMEPEGSLYHEQYT